MESDKSRTSSVFKLFNKNGHTIHYPPNYTIVERIGEGSFGEVFQGEIFEKCNATPSPVAIKKIQGVFDGLESKDTNIAKHLLRRLQRQLREIKIIKSFKHENLVGLKDIYVYPYENELFEDLYIVMDLMECDLGSLIHRDANPKNKESILTENVIKSISWQILKAVRFLQSASVLHRDLKPSNVLLKLIKNENDIEEDFDNYEMEEGPTNEILVKLSDFGLSRAVKFKNEESNGVKISSFSIGTIAYRAPELLFMQQFVTKAVDVWSIGCIIAEMFTKRPIFEVEQQIPISSFSHKEEIAKKNYLSRIDLILDVVGIPDDISKIVGHPNAIEYIKNQKNKMKAANKKPKLMEILGFAPELAKDLISKCLTLSPEDRITVEEAMNHPWFDDIREGSDVVAAPFDSTFEEEFDDFLEKTSDSPKEDEISDWSWNMRDKIWAEVIGK